MISIASQYRSTSRTPIHALSRSSYGEPPSDPLAGLSLTALFSPDRLKELELPPEYHSALFVFEAFGAWNANTSLWDRLGHLVRPSRERAQLPVFGRLRHPVFPVALFREEMGSYVQERRLSKRYGLAPEAVRVQEGLHFVFALHREDITRFDRSAGPYLLTCWSDWLQTWCPSCGIPTDGSLSSQGAAYRCTCGASCAELRSWIRCRRMANPRVGLLISHLDEDVYRKSFKTFYDTFPHKPEVMAHASYLIWLQHMPTEGPRCRRDKVHPTIRKLWERLATCPAV